MKIFRTLLLASIVLVACLLVTFTSATNTNSHTDKKNKIQQQVRRFLRQQQKEQASSSQNHKTNLKTDFYPACDSITSLGYPCENHAIQTADGFVLGAVRIPPTASGAYPVFLQHGLIDCSATWTFNANSNQNLATMLHDAGYDVWLGNSRGNHYSETNLNHPGASSAAYYRSTDMDLMAKYDVPANIGYILNATGRATLSIVGHSQGTWQMFSHFATSKKYIRAVDIYLAFAPVTRVEHTTSLLLKFLAGIDTAQWLSLFGDKWFLSNDAILRLVGGLCPDFGKLCADVLMPLIGNFNPNNMNISRLDNYLRYGPGGASVQNMIHWSQEVNDQDGGYAMHDYGSAINQEMYNSSSAPRYDLALYTGPPTILFSGTDDALADPQDVEGLIARLNPGGALVEPLQPFTGWAHMDFVWGLDAAARLYQPAINFIKKYQKN